MAPQIGTASPGPAHRRHEFTRRVSPRRLGVLAIVAVLAVGSLSTASAGAATPEEGARAAEAGAAWLAEQLGGGLPLENFGSPDWGVTVDAGLALAAAGTGAEQLASLWEGVEAARDSVVAPWGGDSPGRLAKMILLARALGEDPRAVGVGEGSDLVERLVALRQLDGPDTGLFGTDNALYDGAYRQGLSIVALVAAGAEVDPTSVTWLEDQQCDDGAWMPYRSELDEPCAFDGDLFVGPDSNSVAAAVIGLVAVGGDSTALEPARSWLEANQVDDGGWGFFPGDGSDPNSTAVVIQALLADGSLDDPRFAGDPGDPLDALLSFQLGCDAPEGERGAFTYPFSNDAPSLLSTTQAVPAAALVPIDHVPSTIGDELVPLDCEPPAATPTTTTTAAPETTTTSGPEVAEPTTTDTAPVEVAEAVIFTADASTEVLGSAETPAALALTGTSSWVTALSGLLAVALGGALLVGARRTRLG